MNTIELCNLIKTATPDKKDIMRADDIIKTAVRHETRIDGYCHYLTLEGARSLLANKQLKVIKDPEKFYRRAKAFLDKGITISFANTIYDWQADLTSAQFIKNTVFVVKENEKVNMLLDSI